MATNLALDDQLIEDALRLGGHRTKKAAVTSALKEYVERYRQQEILKLFHKVDYDASYNYKEQRGRS